MALNPVLQWARATGKKIDRAERYAVSPSRISHQREESPADPGLLKPQGPQFQGTYGPRGLKHPKLVLSQRGNAVVVTAMTEGDVPFDARIPKHSLRDAKQDRVLFPGWGRNPLAGLPATESKPGKGLAVPTGKRTTPIAAGCFVEGTGRPLRPPIANVVEQARRKLMAI